MEGVNALMKELDELTVEGLAPGETEVCVHVDICIRMYVCMGEGLID